MGPSSCKQRPSKALVPRLYEPRAPSARGDVPRGGRARHTLSAATALDQHAPQAAPPRALALLVGPHGPLAHPGARWALPLAPGPARPHAPHRHHHTRQVAAGAARAHPSGPTGWRQAPQDSAAPQPHSPRTATLARRQPRSPQAGPMAARALPRRTRPPPTLAAAQAQAAGAEALRLRPRAARRPPRPPGPAPRLVLGVRHLPLWVPAPPRASPQAHHPATPTRPRPAVRLVLGVRHLPLWIPAPPRAIPIPQTRHPLTTASLSPEPVRLGGFLASAQAAKAGQPTI